MRSVRAWVAPSRVERPNQTDGRLQGIASDAPQPRVPNRHRKRCLAAALIIAAVIADGALGGPLATWTRVTDPSGRNTDQLGLARTPDGELHFVWVRKNGANEDLVHGAVGLDGQPVGVATEIETSWGALTNADLLSAGGDLRVLFSGIRSTEPNETYTGKEVYTATSSDGGASWMLDPEGVSAPSSPYASDQVGAALAGKGEAVFAWSTTFGLSVHVGLDPATPNQTFQEPCCAYDADLGTDAKTGEVVLAWFSNAAGDQGLHSATVLPSRSPSKYLPGSGMDDRANAASPDAKIAVTGRLGAGGVYVAYGVGYPTWRTLNLWEHESGKSIRVAAGQNIRSPFAAPGPGGRLWVAWRDGNAIFATRSNTAATRFGPIVTVAPPKGTDTIWKLVGEGSRGPLDLFAAVSTPGSLAFWHTQVRPELTLVARSETKAHPHGAGFTVLDAGDPVAGARVTVGARSRTTDAAGKVKLDLPKGSFTATVTKAGYTGASVRVTGT